MRPGATERDNDLNTATMLSHASVVLLLLVVVLPRDVQAYLDPGTGSLVFQAIVAGLAAAAYGLRSYWTRIRSFFSRTDADKSSDRA